MEKSTDRDVQLPPEVLQERTGLDNELVVNLANFMPVDNDNAPAPKNIPQGNNEPISGMYDNW